MCNFVFMKLNEGGTPVSNGITTDLFFVAPSTMRDLCQSCAPGQKVASNGRSLITSLTFGDTVTINTGRGVDPPAHHYKDTMHPVSYGPYDAQTWENKLSTLLARGSMYTSIDKRQSKLPQKKKIQKASKLVPVGLK
ncbi:unnamed protein product [Ixodes persulcatus]